MKKAGYKKRSLLATLGALLACGLVFSFSLHTIQAEHTHPGSHSQSGMHTESQGGDFEALSEYLHGTEKKLFISALLGFLLLGAFVCLNSLPRVFELLCLFHKRFFTQKLSARLFRFFDVYVQLFSSGLLNTKTY